MNKELILKKSLIGSKREYLEFVIRCLDDEEFVKAMYELFPFSNR